MLWTIAVLLVVLWALGMVSSYTIGGFVHLLLVLAIIELDDSSHKGKEQRDASRDAMLKSAGYKTVRYRKIPDVERVRADLSKQLAVGYS